MKKFPKFVIPKGLTTEHDKIIFCVGELISSWATCETLFYGIFNCITSRENTNIAPVLWLTTKNTKARIDLTVNLARECGLPDSLVAEIVNHAKIFDGLTRTRNLYAHAGYKIDGRTLKLESIETASLIPAGVGPSVVSLQSKAANKATVNELVDAIRRVHELSYVIWPTFMKLREILPDHNLVFPEPFPE